MIRRESTDYRNLRRQPDMPSHGRSAWLTLLCWTAFFVCAIGIVLMSAGGGAILNLLLVHGPSAKYIPAGYSLLVIPGAVCWFAGGALGNYALEELER